MTHGVIAALILSIAVEFGLPPYFVLSVAIEENQTLNPLAVRKNSNGTLDRGVMQLNSGWYNGDWWEPETNIRAACGHIKNLTAMPGVNTWWAVAVCYNAGYGRLYNPPNSTIDYASKVIIRWEEMDTAGFFVLTRRNTRKNTRRDR